MLRGRAGDGGGCGAPWHSLLCAAWQVGWHPWQCPSPARHPGTEPRLPPGAGVYSLNCFMYPRAGTSQGSRGNSSSCPGHLPWDRLGADGLGSGPSLWHPGWWLGDGASVLYRGTSRTLTPLNPFSLQPSSLVEAPRPLVLCAFQPRASRCFALRALCPSHAPGWGRLAGRVGSLQRAASHHRLDDFMPRSASVLSAPLCPG